VSISGESGRKNNAECWMLNVEVKVEVSPLLQHSTFSTQDSPKEVFPDASGILA
jgi:hypothetical protein